MIILGAEGSAIDVVKLIVELGFSGLVGAIFYWKTKVDDPRARADAAKQLKEAMDSSTADRIRCDEKHEANTVAFIEATRETSARHERITELFLTRLETARRQDSDRRHEMNNAAMAVMGKMGDAMNSLGQKIDAMKTGKEMA